LEIGDFGQTRHSVHLTGTQVKRLIIGCGYLGKRIAKRWVAAGDNVYAVTRKNERVNELESCGMRPIIADITRPQSLENLPETDTVLFAVGMDRSQYSNIRAVYVDGLQNVLAKLGPTTSHLIYISSTGVYGDFDGRWIDESAPTIPTREGGKACLEAEQLIATSRFGDVATVLRFAGIYGPDRVPTRALIESREWKKLSANGYLNLIHVDDGARIIESVAAESPAGQLYLVSDGHPPLRREYYQYIAEHFGVTEIPWEEVEATPGTSRSANNKRISNKKLLNRFEINFEYPDFKSGLDQSLENHGF
jgi:nucleoside-diphosphate-sugar epimerase